MAQFSKWKFEFTSLNQILEFIFYIVLNKNWQMFWSKQSLLVLVFIMNTDIGYYLTNLQVHSQLVMIIVVLNHYQRINHVHVWQVYYPLLNAVTRKPVAALEQKKNNEKKNEKQGR